MSVSRLGMATALLSLAVSPLGAQVARIGYINSETVLAEYPPAQEARQALQATLAGYDAELQQLQAGFEQAVEEYQQQQLTMTTEARQAREQELGASQIAVQRRTQELNTQAGQRQAEVFQPIMEAITAVLEEIRVEGNYALILDTASQAILAADPALDLTQEVLTRLQATNSDRQGSQGQGAP